MALEKMDSSLVICLVIYAVDWEVEEASQLNN